VVAVLSAALLPANALAVSPFGDVAAVPETELAEARGMFVAPDGTEIALSIQMDTVVDGTLVLRSVMKPFESAADRLQLYAQRPGSPAMETSAAGAQSAPQSGDGNVAFIFDRSAGLTMVSSTDAMPQFQVSTSADADASVPSGLERISLDGAGAAVVPTGPVTVTQADGGSIVTLATSDLLVKHVLGPSIANVVGNTANNRAIETSTVVNLSLSNTAPLALGASLLSLDAAALALAQRPSF
jgi:hypothetical protein